MIAFSSIVIFVSVVAVDRILFRLQHSGASRLGAIVTEPAAA